MKYLFLMKIKVYNYNYFIEVGKEFNLKRHPNLKDTILVEDFFCSIREILHHVDKNEIWIKLNVVEPQSIVKSHEEAIESLKKDIKELKDYKWYLNDYDLGENNYVD